MASVNFKDLIRLFSPCFSDGSSLLMQPIYTKGCSYFIVVKICNINGGYWICSYNYIWHLFFPQQAKFIRFPSCQVSLQKDTFSYIPSYHSCRKTNVISFRLKRVQIQHLPQSFSYIPVKNTLLKIHLYFIFF